MTWASKWIRRERDLLSHRALHNPSLVVGFHLGAFPPPATFLTATSITTTTTSYEHLSQKEAVTTSLSGPVDIIMTTPARTPQSAGATPKRPSKTASSQSLNHLLNFTLPPRQSHQQQSLPRRARKTGNQHGFWNKERKYRTMVTIISPASSPSPPSIGFVNAQYRFVMNPNGDYTVHFADPDM